MRTGLPWIEQFAGFKSDSFVCGVDFELWLDTRGIPLERLWDTLGIDTLMAAVSYLHLAKCEVFVCFTGLASRAWLAGAGVELASCGADMGCHVAKYWVATGSSCAPLVDETAEEESEERCSVCCCRWLPFRHESRNMEVSIEPSGSGDWSHSHMDLRSFPGRDVHVTFPAIEESPKSTSSRSHSAPRGGGSESFDGSGHVVPAPLKGLVESIAAELGSKGELQVAGMPLEEFWSKLLTLEFKGPKGAFARAEKVLQFRRRFSWPLSI
eukprot:Skav236275  [mRNA]  locus=scaffold2289:117005:131835:+ [translate_table: standard]